MNNLNVKAVQDEITSLLLAYPELEEDEVLRADTIEGQTSTFEFLSGIVRKIGSTNALADGTQGYIGELKERLARLDRRVQALRSLIGKIMNTADLRKAELAEATISISAGRPKVVIVNEQEIPKDFLRIKTEPDKIRIGAALTAHEHVPGCVLSNAEPTLRILVK